MPVKKGSKLHKNIIVAFSRIMEGGGVLSRQSSMAEDAQKRGGGFLYYSPNTSRQISPNAARFLIEKEILKPVPDGLFDGQSQSFRAVSYKEFNDFKERYEQLPVR